MADPTLILLRHGETVNTQQRRITGTLDVPLSEQGRAASFPRVQELLREFAIARVSSSPLSRARETASMLWTAARQTRPLVSGEIQDGLRPWDEGRLQGRPIAYVKSYLDRLEENPMVPAPDGESFNAFLTRFLGCLRLLLKHAGAVRDRGAVVAVTHSRNIETALAWHAAGMRGTRLDPATRTRHATEPPGHASIWRYRVGRWHLEER